MTPGRADLQGCLVGEVNLVDLHIIDQAKSGACIGGAGSCKSPIEGAEVRVFDRNKLDTLTITALDLSTVTLTKNPNGSLYDDIFESPVVNDPDPNMGALAASLGCITDSNGFCTAGGETTGDFLVIVKYVDVFSGKTVYTGKPISPEDYEDTDADGIGDLGSKDFQVIKVLRKNGTVQFSGGSKKVVTGSFLEIIHPDYAIWDEGTTSYVYPFIMTSDSDWTVDVCAEVPIGYRIVGIFDDNGDFISSGKCTHSFVANETKVIAFDVEDLASPRPNLAVRINARHSGKPNFLEFDLPGFREGKDKKDEKEKDKDKK